jgi:PAS domain S-box-containing protein
VIIIDHEGRVLYFNPAAQRTFGYDREDAVGRELAELIIPPATRGAHRSSLARYLATSESRILDRRLELMGMRADGSEFPVELAVTRIPDSDPPSFAGYVRDITERQRAQEQLEAALSRERDARADAERQRFHSRRLVAQTLQAEEQARRQLACALHDGPAQDLLAAQLELPRAASGKPDAIPRVEAAVAHALSQLREAIFDLYPPTLEAAGLRVALRELASELTRRQGLRVALEIDRGVRGVHDRLVFSLCREFLSNAARHAQATDVAVRIWRQEGELVLEVEDNGVGLPQQQREEALRDGHIGLASAAERVQALSGDLYIGPAAVRGTIVRAIVPARRSADTDPSADPDVAAHPNETRSRTRPERRSIGI